MPDDRSPRTNSRGRARRERVLAAAADAFAAEGFRGSSTANIGADVGISDAGVLHHFGTKQRLLFEVLEGHEAAASTPADELRSTRGLAQGLVEIVSVPERH